MVGSSLLAFHVGCVAGDWCEILEELDRWGRFMGHWLYFCCV